MPGHNATLLLVVLLLSSALPPLQCTDGVPLASPRAEPAPPWAIGSRWTWVADQDLDFCITLSGATIRINHVSGDMKDSLTNLTTFNGTAVYQVDALYSETLTGTLTVFGFPAPISWPVTGNGTSFYRIPDLAVVYQYQHISVDMGSLLGKFVADNSLEASPPAESYRFPLDVLDHWRIGSDVSVWTRTSGAGGAFETTSNDRLDADATVPRMQDATVPAGTFSCYNITYNGTYTSGSGAPTPQNSSVLYSPKATNVMYRNFSPMAGMDMVFSLSSFSLNHAPAVASPVPDVTFSEDTTGTLYLATVFSDEDAGDRLGFAVSNFTNITATVDNSTGVATFVAPQDWSGTERIVFSATDSKGADATTAVNVTVMPENDQPKLSRPLPAIIMDEDTINDTLDLSQYFDDVDFAYGDSLAFSFRENGSIGVSISPSGIVGLRPFDNWSGVLNITITATDTAGERASGVLKVAVLNTPDAPVVEPGFGEIVMSEDTWYIEDIQVVDADIPYGDVLTYSVEDIPSGFSVELDLAAGNMKLIPPKDYNGRNSVTVVITDRSGLNCSLKLIIYVREVNDPPAILGSFPGGDKRTIAENTSTDFSVVAADIDNPYTDLHLAWYLDRQKIATGANYTYFADFESSGAHNLTAIVDDGLDSVSRTWNLTVTNVNRPPANLRIASPANGSKFKTGETISFSAVCSDPDNDPLTFSWKDTNGNQLGAGRSIELKTLSKGKHVVTLEVSDGNATKTASVTVSVSPPAAARTPGFGIFSFLAAGALLALHAKRRRLGRRDGAARSK